VIPNLFIHWSEEIVIQMIEALDISLSSRYGPGAHRGILNRTRDDLHDLCTKMERDGKAESEEEVYLCLFDCLSNLTEALRHRVPNMVLLHHARKTLAKLRKLTVDCETAAKEVGRGKGGVK
jgi:hypothetical protein